MNLLQDKWITVVRKNGEIEKVAPFEITGKIGTNPIIEIITPRPDFKGALYQFLIGLFQTVYAPKDESEWEDRLNRPPKPEILKLETDKVAFAFDLFGNKIRFMQDIRLQSAMDENSIKPIEYLLVDSPGKSTTEKNRDLFVKRNRIMKTCFSCSASALFTMQINAPEGGSGNYTSLRGGGPLTTIVKNNTPNQDLWTEIWLNIISEPFINLKKLPGKNFEKIFPWLTDKFFKSEGSENISSNELHSYSVYWSNPRRIFLINNNKTGDCEICSAKQTFIIEDFVAKNQGINYGNGNWIHPLSPYRLDKENWFCHHPHPGGITYDSWATMIYENSDKSKNAKIVSLFNEHRTFKEEQTLIWAFGYDMDSMTARCWYESLIPIYRIPPHNIEKYESTISTILSAATQVANHLQTKVKDAWFNERQKPKGDTNYLKIVFFKATESKFFTLAKSIRDNLQSETIFDDSEKLNWLKYLNEESLKIFDQYVESGSIEYENIQRIVNARRDLTLWNFGDKIKKALGLPIRDKKQPKEKTKK
ncbi:type I-E CRISPR-associated protein Cse1/CasA [Leptospira stimsonii]|uniref:Type I-E CRISPR-associated protein Cse1/CasA n=1 Tax=Leptospira stimsonii TaxID=2202203 RepID=A0A8B3CKE6_9LEPT|nr:type I-E CRISPR-associated protein Cse1/CasA [Leptospira stimsonii]RHX83878.1 type I-E CRISPR-associated protein Cse1/CasA [Leptospira stimsonii]